MKTMSDKSEYVELSLMTRQELYDLIKELNDRITEHNEGSVAGLYIMPGYRDLVRQLFPVDQDEPFKRLILGTQDIIHELGCMRYRAAISGAMRWKPLSIQKADLLCVLCKGA